jgi:hypothetical protein
MLTSAKQKKISETLKKYSKKYLNGKLTELDESGTRLMINEFLSDVLGFAPIEEIKTEYMIKGTYADYVVQLKGTRHFLVEVKALSINLSESHLRQAVNYGANEGIEWALLTNGKCFDFYKILFNKPIESRKVFSIDFSDPKQLKDAVETVQFLHKDSVSNKGLDMLWNKCIALDPANVAGFLYTPNVINFIKKSLKDKYKHKFSDEEIKASIDKIVFEEINLEHIKHVKVKKTKTAKSISSASSPSQSILETRLEAHETSVDTLTDSTTLN